MAQTLNLARDNLDLCPLPSDVTLQLLPPDLYQSNVANLSSTDEDALHIFSDELTAMGGGGVTGLRWAHWDTMELCSSEQKTPKNGHVE